MPKNAFRAVFQAAITRVTNTATETTECLIDCTLTIGTGLETQVYLIKTTLTHGWAKRVNRFTGLMLKTVKFDDVSTCNGLSRRRKQIFTGKGAMDMPSRPDTATDGG